MLITVYLIDPSLAWFSKINGIFSQKAMSTLSNSMYWRYLANTLKLKILRSIFVIFYQTANHIHTWKRSYITCAIILNANIFIYSYNFNIFVYFNILKSNLSTLCKLIETNNVEQINNAAVLIYHSNYIH